MLMVAELTKRIRKSGRHRSHEERLALLQKAHILDADGKLVSFFCSAPDENPSSDKKIVFSIKTLDIKV
ncbi:hypothetical protein [Thiomicrospira microaerophila]|uniref:hypothetical protein n=1 Tax=Thiomicrospira microaerophila TaxID=406020 RepID=UPI0005C99F76|nr:hypothetical protein [Thiomicrospira microaerophila]